MVNKKKTLLYTVGCAALGIAALLVIYGILVVTGVVHLKQNRLVFYGEDKERVFNGLPLTSEGWKMTSGELQDGHRLEVTTVGSITFPGEAENRVAVLVFDENGSDVTDEYDIECIPGTLRVKRVPITVASQSASKIYDGTPLSNNECYVSLGQVISGHKLVAEAVSSITDIGTQENNITVAVIDEENGEDVTRYYDISKELGVLEIERRKVTVTTASDGKEYDGTPITNGDFSLVGDFMPGHVAEVHVLGSAILPGNTENIATVKILDENGKDITSVYEIITNFGTLSIVGNVDGGGSGGSGGNTGNSDSGSSGGVSEIPSVSANGTISGSDLNNKETSLSEKTEYFSFTSDYTGNILLRMKHFGDYRMNGWVDLKENDNDDVMLFLGDSFKANGVESNEISIELINGCSYLLPYYSLKNTVDVSKTKYSVVYYNYDYTVSEESEHIKILDEDEEYRDYVYSNYLELPQSTKNAMLGIFGQEMEKLGKKQNELKGRELIAWVEQYVKNAGTYDLNFPKYPENVDTAVYFLKTAKTGCCRHFATAAVAMYRALGIPARYTVGFSVDSVAGETTVVKGDRAHAWVEVYVDEMGWIAVDPTGGSSGAGNEESAELDKVYIKSGSANKFYDGQALTSNYHEIQGLPKGYTYKISFLGSQTEIGSSKNKFTVKIFDENGVDVTDEAEIIKEEGNLTVETHKLIIISDGAKKNYNGKPLTHDKYSVVGKLFEGHKLEVTCTGTITEPGTEENKFEYKILDEFGNDVTEGYEVEERYGYLTISTIPLTIKGENAEKVYDGTPLTCDVFTVQGGVLPGHTPKLTFSGTRTEPGISENPFECVIVDENGEDVTEKYLISRIYGSLNVKNPDGTDVRMLTVISEGATKTYDGTALVNEKFTYSGELAPGHSINYVATGSQTKVGKSKNTFEVRVFEGDIDVTEQYNIIKGEGILTVEPIQITVFSGSAQKDYDGEALVSEEFWYVGETADGEELKYTLTGSQTEVGTSENTVVYQVVDKDGNDVTENYAITEELGELTVEPLQITVITESAYKIYDGTPLKNENYTVECDNKYDHEIKVTVTGFRVEPGTSKNDIRIEILDSEGNDVSKNYAVNVSEGDLTVYSDIFAFISASDSKTYDGFPLEAKEAPLARKPLPPGWSAVFNVKGIQNGVGSSLNEFDVMLYDENGKDVTSEYEVKKIYGDLTVYPIYIQIETGSAEKQYDGTHLTDEYNQVVVGSFLYGHKAEIECIGEQTDVGSSKNRFSVKVTDANGNDVTDCYYFSPNLGTLTVTKKKISIVSEDFTKVYDGVLITKGPYNAAANLVSGHKLAVAFTSSIINVGSCDAAFKVTVYDGAGKVVTSNYDITTVFGKWTITPIELYFSTGSAEKIYDGTLLTCNEWKLEEGEVLNGHVLSVTTNGSQLQVGTSKNFASAIVRDQNGRNVSNNYKFYWRYGDLVVSPISGEFDDTTDDLSDTKQNPDFDMFKVNSNISGKMLLKGKSYGDYQYGGWGAAPSDEDQEMSLTLPYYALSGLIHSVTITPIVKMDPLTTYYANTVDPEKTYDDGQYMYRFRSFSYIDDPVQKFNSNYSIQKQEPTYRQYVYANYTALPADTKAAMMKILENAVQEENFDIENASLKEIVTWVENYIKNAATYSYEYNYPKGEDSAIRFFTEQKGVCRHFATAATVMYRALGIPARYVQGYSADAQRYKTVTVSAKQAHAWVEVYIDGLGWVTVDPTPSAPEEEFNGNKRVLKVTSNSGTFVYDGKTHRLEEFTILSGTLAPGHSIYPSFTGEIKDRGDMDNTWMARIIDSNGKDVTSQYDLTLLNGALTMLRREVILIPDIETVVYNGQEFKAGENSITHQVCDSDRKPIVIMDELVVTYSGSITDIGSVTTRITSVKAYDKNKKDVTSNYSFSYSDRGKITVVPRSITVTSGTYAKVYDGSDISYDGVTLGTNEELLAGHRLEVEYGKTGSAIAVYDNVFTAKVVDEDGNDVSDKYDIKKVYGKLTVAYAQLEFETTAAKKVYDGKALIETSRCKLISNNLMNGHTVAKMALEVKITEPGTVKNVPTVKIVDRNGKDVTWMYIIGDEKCGTLTVEKYEITVTSASATQKLSSGPLESDKFRIDSIVKGHTVQVSISGYIDTVGACDNQIDDIKIFDEKGNDVTHCYHVTKVNGVLTIIP